MKILLGDLNEKVRREDIFKPTIRNESLHEISYVKGVFMAWYLVKPRDNFTFYINLSRVL
jgi:hypothetical protein